MQVPGVLHGGFVGVADVLVVDLYGMGVPLQERVLAQDLSSDNEWCERDDFFCKALDAMR